MAEARKLASAMDALKGRFGAGGRGGSGGGGVRTLDKRVAKAKAKAVAGGSNDDTARERKRKRAAAAPAAAVASARTRGIVPIEAFARDGTAAVPPPATAVRAAATKTAAPAMGRPAVATPQTFSPSETASAATLMEPMSVDALRAGLPPSLLSVALARGEAGGKGGSGANGGGEGSYLFELVSELLTTRERASGDAASVYAQKLSGRHVQLGGGAGERRAKRPPARAPLPRRMRAAADVPAAARDPGLYTEVQRRWQGYAWRELGSATSGRRKAKDALGRRDRAAALAAQHVDPRTLPAAELRARLARLDLHGARVRVVRGTQPEVVGRDGVVLRCGGRCARACLPMRASGRSRLFDPCHG